MVILTSLQLPGVDYTSSGFVKADLKCSVQDSTLVICCTWTCIIMLIYNLRNIGLRINLIAIFNMWY